MSQATRARPRPRVPHVTMNSDGKRHPLVNGLAIFTLAAGAVAFALGFVVARHVIASWLGLATNQRMEKYRKEVMGARLILVEGYIQSSPEEVTHLVAQRLTDRSHDLTGLANDALARKHALPVGPALIEPLNDDRRDHLDMPAQKIRHPRNVRILPPSRDFH